MVTRWEKLKATQRMQDHIEAHLTEPITLSALARAARYSPWYAARIFKECTGRAPFAYIRLRRLSAAASRMAHSQQRVIDIAFDFVFDSHDGFTRAFARQFGMTPRAFRKLRPRLELFVPPAARDAYIARQKGECKVDASNKAVVVFVQVVERPARKLIVRRGVKARHYFEYCEEVGCEVWEELGRIESALHEPMGLWLPEKLSKEGTSTYVQGVEVPEGYQGSIPEGYELIDLEACKWMVFQGPPFEESQFESAISSLWDAINQYHPETCGYEWADEDAPRFQLAPFGYRGYIEGRPVRPINAS